MKIAVYPGSFNPWHEGHSDILRKSLQVFDKVIVSAGRNPDKTEWDYDLNKMCEDFRDNEYRWINGQEPRIIVRHFTGLLIDHIAAIEKDYHIDAVIRGLRNGSDLQYEMNQQYWNEDLGIKIPTVYFICDRKLGHISSSILRSLRKFDGDKGKVG